MNVHMVVLCKAVVAAMMSAQLIREADSLSSLSSSLYSAVSAVVYVVKARIRLLSKNIIAVTIVTIAIRAKSQAPALARVVLLHILKKVSMNL